MPVAILNAVVRAAVLTGWLAVGAYWYLHERRRRPRRAQWEHASAGLSGLDAELDRVWSAVHKQSRRSP